MGSDVFWIKLQTNAFDSETIMLLESMPEGDTILIIWFKMQILAGRCNAGGYLLLNGESPYSDEMLATVFRRSLNTVRLAISAFLKFKMVEIIDEAYFLLDWEKYQNVSGLEKIKEQTRKRVAKYRAKTKEVTLPVTLQVTQSNAIETETEREIEEKQQTVLLLEGTPFCRITEQEISVLVEHFGSERVKLTADIAAETWRTNKKAIRNPGGYLHTLCENLVIPEGYEPPDVRAANSKAAAERKRAEDDKHEELKKAEAQESKERDDYWHSLSEEDRQKHRDEFMANAPFLQDPNEDFLNGLAKLTAWEKRQQINTNTSSSMETGP
jgi:predicted phage replisome organizer